MKKKYLLPVLAAAALLIFTGCDSNSGEKTTAEPEASAESSAAKKPAGVPTATYNKVKTLEAQHNDQLEKALEP